MLWRKQQFTVGETFCEGRESVTDGERSGRTATSRTEEKIAKVRQIVRENRRLTVRSIAEQVNIDRETVRKILKILTWGRGVQEWSQRSSSKNKSKEESQFAKTVWRGRWHFGPCHHRWWNMGLPIRPWNEAVKCTMKDCQFPTTKKVLSVQIKS